MTDRHVEWWRAQTLVGRQIRAGVFDMDGVLLDSEPLHHQAVNAILREDGRPQLSLCEYARYLGVTD